MFDYPYSPCIFYFCWCLVPQPACVSHKATFCLFGLSAFSHLSSLMFSSVWLVLLLWLLVNTHYHCGRGKLCNDFDWHANPQGELVAISDEATRPSSCHVNNSTTIQHQLILIMSANKSHHTHMMHHRIMII